MHDRLGARVVSRLEPALRRRLAEQASDKTSDAAIFVALSPGDRARVYEGFLDWDIGLLAIGPDQLHYRGEQIALGLSRMAVRAIEVGAVAPGWIRAPRVIVRWLGPTGEEALTLRAADARSVSEIGPASRALAARLSAWRGGGEVAEGGRAVASAVRPSDIRDPMATDVGNTRAASPGIGPVTASTLAEASAPRDLPMLVALLGTFSAGASFMLGLDFWLGLDVFAAALIGVMAMRWPATTSREPSPSKAGEAELERRAA